MQKCSLGRMQYVILGFTQDAISRFTQDDDNICEIQYEMYNALYSKCKMHDAILGLTQE